MSRMKLQFTFLIVLAGISILLGCTADLNVGETTTKEIVVDGEEILPIDNQPDQPADQLPEQGEEEEESSAEPADELTGSVVAEEDLPQTHAVDLIEGGFSTDSITIKVGDSVVWKNEREGRYTKGLIIGAQKCRAVRSDFLAPGDSFTWTFTKAETCLIVDGIYTTEVMKVIVEP